MLDLECERLGMSVGRQLVNSAVGKCIDLDFLCFPSLRRQQEQHDRPELKQMLVRSKLAHWQFL